MIMTIELTQGRKEKGENEEEAAVVWDFSWGEGEEEAKVSQLKYV